MGGMAKTPKRRIDSKFVYLDSDVHIERNRARSVVRLRVEVFIYPSEKGWLL